MKLLEFLAYFTIAAIIGFFLWVECANAAQWEIVSFNDAEHLGVLQDSVVEVCDTVVVVDTLEIFSSPQSPYVQGFQTVSTTIIRIDTIAVDTAYTIYVEIIRDIITCRQLVGVTVTKHVEDTSVTYGGLLDAYATDEEKQEWCDEHPIGSPVIHPGQALIFYEEVRQ